MFAIIGNIKGNSISTQGIGLGLSICKQLVEKLGGYIKIDSVIGKGSTVVFTFPFKCVECQVDHTQLQNSGLTNSLHRSNPESFNDNQT